GVQLASLEATPWTPTKGFVPVRLEGYANARELLTGASVKPGSLPAAGTTIGGIPLVFSGVNPEGNDHIDVGRSLYRQANLEGYLPSSEPRGTATSRRAPPRIQLRIPTGQYDSLYLLAASDEKPDSVPLVSAMFFRPGAGFAESFAAEVPRATAKSTSAL